MRKLRFIEESAMMGLSKMSLLNTEFRILTTKARLSNCLGKNISWEGHLAGMIVGIITAFIYRREGPQAYQIPDDEDEDPPDWYPSEEHEDQQTTIHYHFRPKENRDRL